MHYLIECFIDEGLKERIDQLRPEHLQYIDKNKASIVFGGVVTDDSGGYQKILYNYKCEGEMEAQEFVEGDPYYEIFHKTNVSLFIQKI